MSGIYAELLHLASQLGSEDLVKKRRDAANKLVTLLVRPNLHSRLEREARARGGGIVAQCNRLSQLWRVLIHNSLVASSKSLGKRTKLLLEDVMLPYRVLCACDARLIENPQQEEQRSNLTSKEILELLKYCLNMLVQDDAKAVAERDLLTMLHHLCARQDYVVHYRPHAELNNILAELSGRLICKEEFSEATTFLSAAKTWQVLFQTSANLGMGLHLVIAQSMELVCNFCVSHANSTTTSQALPYIYGGLTALLKTHPEQCMEPLKRHGRPILVYARRSFAHAQGFNQSALTEYFLAHLLVCQAAGRVQGLMQGDLGNVGKASLDGKGLERLLSLMASETALSKVLSTDNSSARGPRRKRRAASTMPELNARQLCHLNLCARLLACHQRLFVANAEWDALEAPFSVLVDRLSEARKEGDDYCFLKHPTNPFLNNPLPRANLSDITKSPWIKWVAQHLWLAAPSPVADKMKEAVQARIQENKPLRVGEALEGIDEDKEDLCTHFSILSQFPQGNESLPVKSSFVVNLLQVVCACAESFPAGECWSLTGQENWQTLVPKDLIDSDIVHWNGCNAQDLALVIYLISNLLETYGGIGGEGSVQYSCLQCLIRLTETTAIATSITKCTFTSIVGRVWRRIWQILMRPDLVYASCTEAAKPNSMGESVLVLLTEMVRNSCTDPDRLWQSKETSFAHQNQSHVWSLPVFGSSVKSASVYELVYVCLRHVGLSDQGNDSISDSKKFGTSSASRGQRLLDFMFSNVQTLLSSNTVDQKRVLAAAACIVLLVGGSRILCSTTFSRELDQKLQTDRGDSENRLDFSWWQTWDSQANGDVVQQLVDADIAALKANTARSLLREKERDYLLKDSEPGSDATMLLPMATSKCADMLERFRNDETNDTMIESQESSEKSDVESPNKLGRILGSINVYMGILVSVQTSSEIDDQVEEVLLAVLEDVLKELPSVTFTATWASDLLHHLHLFLLGIRAFFVNERCKVEASFFLEKKLKKVFNMCKSILLNKQQKSNNTQENEEPWSQKTPNSQSLESDDSDYEKEEIDPVVRFSSDESDAGGNRQPRKRKRKARSKNVSRREEKKREEEEEQVQDLEEKSRVDACERSIASILVLLDPSYDTSFLVANKLLHPFLDEESWSVAGNHLNVENAVYCFELLSKDETLYHKFATEHLANLKGDTYDPGDNSIVALCATILRAIRSSGPGLRQQSACFTLCAKLICKRESYLEEDPMPVDDGRDAIGVLMCEETKTSRKYIRLRPHIRAERVFASKSSFRHGRAPFHKEFDHDFATRLVLPSLGDVSAIVRRSACSSVAAALQILEDQERITESVLGTLPPLTRTKDPDKVLLAFRRWYENKDLGSQGKLTEIENLVWDDALASVELDSMMCRAFIAGATTDDDIFRHVLWEMIKVAYSRPDLESLCFQACDRIALMRGFECAEDLLHDECEWLIFSWLQSKKNLTSMPLLMSSPCLVRQQLRACQPSFTGTETSRNEDECELRNSSSKQLLEEAAQEYVDRNAHLLIPLILLYSETMNPSDDEEVNARSTRGLEYFREVCSLVGIDKTDVVRVLLRTHYRDIFAFLAPLTHAPTEQSGTSAEIASRVLTELEEALSEFKETSKRRSKYALFIVRRMLQLCGKREHHFQDIQNPPASYSKAILGFTSEVQSSQDESEEEEGLSLLNRLGITAAECLLYAKAWIRQSSTRQQKERGFTVVEILCDLFAHNDGTTFGDASQIGFLLHVIQALLVESNELKGRSLQLLTEVLHKNSVSLTDKSVSSDLYKLFGTTVLVHTAAQDRLIEECVKLSQEHLAQVRRSLGLLMIRESLQTDDSLEDDAVLEPGTIRFGVLPTFKLHRDKSLKHINAAIVASYDVVLSLMEIGKQSMGKSPSMFVSILANPRSRAEERRVLEETNPKLYVQDRVFETYSEGSEFAYDDCTEELVAFASHIKSRSSFIRSTLDQRFLAFEGVSRDSFDLTQSLVVAELDYLSDLLRRSAQSSNESIAALPRETYAFVNELLSLCEGPSPLAVKISVSRCLGELEANKIEPFASSPLQSSTENEKDDMPFQTRSLEVLNSYLRSPNVSTALTALETIKSMVATDKADKIWRLLPRDVKNFLSPFRMKSSHQKNNTEIPRQRLRSIKTLLGEETLMEGENPSWCWNKKLWSCQQGSNFSYREWIMCVVPSIISCFYANKGSSQSEARWFFRSCLEMSSIEAGFASLIFPGLIFDLVMNELLALQNSEQMLTNTQNITNGRIQQISEAFSCLLEADRQGDEAGALTHSEAVRVAIKAVNAIRETMQHTFISSTEHTRNQTALPGRSYRDTTAKSTSRRSPPKTKNNGADYNNNIPPGPDWEGIPFDFVLNISGLKIAEACIRVKDFASALFYAEMHADNKFLGSTGFLDRAYDAVLSRKVNLIPQHGSEKKDGNASDEPDLSANDPYLREALTLSLALQNCYRGLHEDDNYAAVQFRANALNFAYDERDQHTEMASHDVSDMQISHQSSWIGSGESARGTIRVNEEEGTGNSWQNLASRLSDWDAMGNVSGVSSTHLNSSDAPGQTDTTDFYAPFAEALGSLRNGDIGTCSKRLIAARQVLLEDIAGDRTSESGLVSQLCEKLQVLNDFEDFCRRRSTALDLVSKWKLDGIASEASPATVQPQDVFLKSNEFQEFTLSSREFFLRALCNGKLSLDGLEPERPLTRHLWRFCDSARTHGRADVAFSCLDRLQKDSVLSNFESHDLKLRLRFEHAKITETAGDFKIAIMTAKQLVDFMKHKRSASKSANSDDSESLLSDVLITLGSWMSEYKVEAAETTLTNYLKPSSRLARQTFDTKSNKENARRSSSAYLNLAVVAADLFDGISKRTKTLDWKKTGTFLEEKRNELERGNELLEEKQLQFHATKGKGRSQSSAKKEQLTKEYQDLYRHTRRLQREIEIPLSERQKIEQSIPLYLEMAIRSFGSALSICGPESQGVSQHVFRLVSLWFASRTVNTAFSEGSVGEVLKRIPSFRFVPLANQIFSRIGGDGDEESENDLKDLICRMCSEHPYHTLVQIIALSNGGKGGSAADEESSKVWASKDIIATVDATAPSFVSKLIESYIALIDSYVDLAMTPKESFQENNATKGISFAAIKGKGRLDKSLRRGFECPPCVITSTPQLRPSSDYGDGKKDPIGAERIQGFESTFSITETGIHRPKIVICIGTKGGKFKQLVKGEDDIRQDAVMQQVFTCVNDLMKRTGTSRTSDSSSKKRLSESTKTQLRLATYNILPLSPASGVLEWVDNTMPLGDFLMDKSKKNGDKVGAHSKYYPGEWGHGLCMNHYRNAPPNAKRRAFDIICEHFSPAFRFFFLERFSRSPQAWYAAKKNYTRSCAVSSIVGHMLGIGDRHAQNILVHEKTGELVHIDFGIVFEQGRSLMVPEMVPFRLTRDVIDGMGPCGTEGVFTHAAEATTAVLRENASTLLTILSSVVEDPLVQWTVNPVKAREKQNAANDEEEEEEDEESRFVATLTTQEPEGTENEVASRAIARIHEKLQGYEDGVSGEQQSIQAQVQLLINVATDADNLCKMYHGWAPWL